MSVTPPQYTWNAKVNQYVDARGRFVPRVDVKAALEDVVDAARADVDRASRALQAGEIEVDAWFRAMAASVKTINVASGTLGVGGRHNLDHSALGWLGARVKEQYQYLRRFAREVEAGLPLDGGFLARAGQYADSGRPTYEATLRKADLAAGFAFERRLLGAAEHCDQCAHEASLGWQPSGVLLAIGECECLNHCHCEFERSKADPRESAPSREGATAMSLVNAIRDRPWAITEEGLRTIEAVAARDGLDPRALAAKLGRPLDNTRAVTMRGGVATIPVLGPIFRHAGLLTEISGATTTAAIATDFRAALDDPTVAAIVLEVDSPGGEATGIGELSGMIHGARGVKPIVAYVSGLGCSAAYWLASAADEVVVAPSAILGSIGALVSYDRRKPDDPEPVVIKSVQSPEKYHDPESVKGQSRMQAVVNAIGAVFVEDVARNRGVSADDVMLRYGRGGVKVGKDSVDAGMADRVGSLEGVISELCDPARRRPRSNRAAPPAAAHTTPRPERTAMSAENRAGAGEHPPAAAITAADLATLREEAARYKAEAREAHAEVIKAAAAAFVASITAGPQGRITPAMAGTARADFVVAATDDREHPLEGRPRARQEALERAYATRKPHGLTAEHAVADPLARGRALAEDPAVDAEGGTVDAGLASLDAAARKYGKSLNGTK